MWLWIVAGALAYLALLTVLFGVLRSARTADRLERAAVRAWRRERFGATGRISRGGRSVA